MSGWTEKLSDTLGGGPLRKTRDPNIVGEIWTESGFGGMGFAFGRFRNPAPLFTGSWKWGRGIRVLGDPLGTNWLVLRLSDEEIDEGIEVLKRLCVLGQPGVWKFPESMEHSLPPRSTIRFGFRKFKGEASPQQLVTVSFANYWFIFGRIRWFRLSRSQLEKFIAYLLEVKAMSIEPEAAGSSRLRD